MHQINFLFSNVPDAAAIPSQQPSSFGIYQSRALCLNVYFNSISQQLEEWIKTIRPKMTLLNLLIHDWDSFEHSEMFQCKLVNQTFIQQVRKACTGTLLTSSASLAWACMSCTAFCSWRMASSRRATASSSSTFRLASCFLRSAFCGTKRDTL